MKNKKIYKMLSIAGSDNTCGAGVQADIKTCHALKAYCLNCITSVTSQNSKKIYNIFTIPSALIESQIKTILSDYSLDCIKIGLISNVDQAKVICKILGKINLKIPIVVDPIYKSSTNKVFNKFDDYIRIYKILSKLKPYFTPNLNEAKVLLKIKFSDKLETKEIVKNFFKIYKSKIVITDGGKKNKYCEDFFLDENKKVCKFFSSRVISRNTHGTGCTFSSALALHLARGFSISKSVKLSKLFTKRCIIKSPDFKLEYGPLSHWL